MTLGEAKEILSFENEIKSRKELFDHFEKFINRKENDVLKGITAFVIIYNTYNNTLEWAKKDFSKVMELCLNENDEDIRKSMKELAEYFRKLYK